MKNKIRTRLGFSAVLAIAVIVLFGFVINFFVSLPSYGDTFKGKLSDSSYSTADAALQGFISNELNGKTTSAKLVNYRTVSKLNTTESEKLGISEENFNSVEKIEITYSIGEEIYTCEMYVCYLEEDGFRYFAPPVFTGERLTGSYYNSIIQSSDFKNCTLNLQSTAAIKIFGIPIKSTTDYKMKIADGIAYYHGETGVLGFGLTLDIYAFDTTEGLRCVCRTYGTSVGEDGFEDYDSGWYSTDIGEVALPFSYSSDSVSDFSLFGIFNGIDHTFYEKTRTGFAVAPAKKSAFTEIAVANSANRSLELHNFNDTEKEIFEMILNQANWLFDCNYVVDDGHLRQAYLKSYADLKDLDCKEIFGGQAPEWVEAFFGAFSVESSSKCDIVDIGSTSFEIDGEAKRLIDKYIK